MSTLSLSGGSLFDLESMFVGLGLMQVPATALPNAALSNLLALVARGLSSMNIFCLDNVLFGLARMHTGSEPGGINLSVNVNVYVNMNVNGDGYGDLDSFAIESASGSVESADANALVGQPQHPKAAGRLGGSLSETILDYTLGKLHTFLPEQLGSVLWALGSVGFVKTGMTPAAQQRLQAVISRMLLGLPVRGAAYCLWGLAKMGFTWADMSIPCVSIPNGKPGKVVF